ncbi:MAG: integrase [Gammaproteobacteria bacterium RIFCSPHIGHO2_02_FULL_39_13]|nr:MAG: integrase [Gammaproteobacteria bacterium RIFCSPHIGHO2_02_FULL_39_13]OGT49883.1 MAG: integrase [Gammaproteobacteria bacterium RIFCSPHIGHO2_12_FULL_39_24]
MALYKRNKTYWVDINQNGVRIQRSTGTSNKVAAREFHDKLTADTWRQSKLNEEVKKTWMEAAIRWVNESSHKRSLSDDKMHLRWLSPFLQDKLLVVIDRNLIDEVAAKKAETGVSVATVNRMLALIRSILNKAANEWEWLDRAPKIKLRQEQNHRIRWLTRDEANRLIQELPEHLSDMALFTLATGLRQNNVKSLKWEDVDLASQHAVVHPDQAKANKAISVPLNDTAMAVLKKRVGMNATFVFTYHGMPVDQVNTKAWRKALKRAGITSFRWHDLRHTWASWHVQNGTSLQELQSLGGWSNLTMVLRYAHLSSSHLQSAANRIYVTNSLHVQMNEKRTVVNNGVTA